MGTKASRSSRAALMALAACAGIAVAGCGSGDSSGSSAAGTTSTGGDAAGIAEAKKIVAEYETARDGFLHDEITALGEKPPTGKTVFLAKCAAPACQAANDAARKGVDALGWKAKQFSFGLSPEEYGKTYDQMLSDPVKPDYIISNAVLPNDAFKDRLTKAEEMGIKTVQISPGSNEDRPGKFGIVAMTQTVDQYCKRGEVAAATALADAGEPGTFVATIDPQIPASQVTAGECFQQEIERLSPSSSVELLKVSVTGPPEANVQTVTNFLQRKPDAKHIFLSISQHAQNLRPALDAVGLKDVKIIAGAPVASDVADMKKGAFLALIQDELSSNGWRAADALARVSVGQDAGPEEFPTGYTRIVDRDNVGELQLTPSGPLTPGEPDAFLNAWGIE